jgi:hypothetical protein
LGPNIFLSILFWKQSTCSCLCVRDKVSYPYKPTGEMIILYTQNNKKVTMHIQVHPHMHTPTHTHTCIWLHDLDYYLHSKSSAVLKP